MRVCQLAATKFGVEPILKHKYKWVRIVLRGVTLVTMAFVSLLILIINAASWWRGKNT
jgi:hypothetical protein